MARRALNSRKRRVPAPAGAPTASPGTTASTARRRRCAAGASRRRPGPSRAPSASTTGTPGPSARAAGRGSTPGTGASSSAAAASRRTTARVGPTTGRAWWAPRCSGPYGPEPNQFECISCDAGKYTTLQILSNPYAVCEDCEPTKYSTVKSGAPPLPPAPPPIAAQWRGAEAGAAGAQGSARAARPATTARAPRTSGGAPPARSQADRYSLPSLPRPSRARLMLRLRREQVPEELLLGATGRSGPPRGGISARSVFLWRSVLYGAFVWARRAPNRPKRRVPARAVQCEACPAGRFSEFGAEACLECTVRPGLGRVIALHCRPSALYRIRKQIWCPYV